jgi:hypothetical protein
MTSLAPAKLRMCRAHVPARALSLLANSSFVRAGHLLPAPRSVCVALFYLLLPPPNRAFVRDPGCPASQQYCPSTRRPHPHPSVHALIYALDANAPASRADETQNVPGGAFCLFRTVTRGALSLHPCGARRTQILLPHRSRRRCVPALAVRTHWTTVSKRAPTRRADR